MVLFMNAANKTPVLAIDGGGTRCRVASADSDGVISVETRSANVSTDFDGSVREILDGILRLGEQIGVTRGELEARPAFVGLAGVTGTQMVERLKAALPFQNVRIEDDRAAALRGSLSDDDGFLAHCGTGSFFGVQRDGAQRFVGGWGSVLGDEASAQWIGRRALAAALDTVDGRRERSPLTDDLLSKFEGAEGIVRFAGSVGPSEFGMIAQNVTAAAQRKDPNAADVMQAGAGEISQTLLHLGWQPGDPICLTGGIGPYYAPMLPDEMRRCVVDPKGSPLDGAVSLARELAREVIA